MPRTSQDPVRPAGTGRPDLRSVFSDLVRLETEIWNAVEARLRADHGVTLPRFEVMQVISQTAACRVHDIAAGLSITIGGASKIVDRIEATGDCLRRANPDDRRSSIVELTPAGQRQLSAVTATVEDELSARLGPALTDRSLAQLSKTLTGLRAAVRSAGPAA